MATEPIHCNWMAQIGGDHVALFYLDGRVELRPQDGDPIIIDAPPRYQEVIAAGLGSQEVLALQFGALANFVGQMRNSVIELLGVLPDSVHREDDDQDEGDCWTWAWDTLTGDAQDEVKGARTNANKALKG